MLSMDDGREVRLAAARRLFACEGYVYCRRQRSTIGSRHEYHSGSIKLDLERG